MKTLVLTGALVLVAGTVSAATMSADFDLRAGGSVTNQPQLTYSNNGVDLTVTGLVCPNGVGPNNSGCTDNALIDRSSTYGIYFKQPNDSDHHVDGDGSTDEYLKLAFNPQVTLQSIKFSYWDGDDNARVYSFGNGSWTLEKNIGSGSSFWYEYVFSESYTGSMFLVGARDDNDEWKLKKVSVTYETPSQVPLPAAGWMLIAGLAGIGALSRRRKAG